MPALLLCPGEGQSQFSCLQQPARVRTGSPMLRPLGLALWHSCHQGQLALQHCPGEGQGQLTLAHTTQPYTTRFSSTVPSRQVLVHSPQCCSQKAAGPTLPPSKGSKRQGQGGEGSISSAPSQLLHVHTLRTSSPVLPRQGVDSVLLSPWISTWPQATAQTRAGFHHGLRWQCRLLTFAVPLHPRLSSSSSLYRAQTTLLPFLSCLSNTYLLIIVFSSAMIHGSCPENDFNSEKLKVKRKIVQSHHFRCLRSQEDILGQPQAQLT